MTQSDYAVVAKQEAEVAERHLAIVQGESLLLDKLKDFQQRCVEPEKKLTKLAETIRELAEAVQKAEFVDPKQAEEIQALLDRRLFEEENLTEAAGGKIIRMTDKTKFELAAMFAKTVSTLEKDKFHLDANSYVHVDELKIRIPRMISLCCRYILSEGDRKRFLEELKEIWSPVKTGVKK